MTPEQIYKANISHSHEAALDAVFNAGITVGMAKLAEGIIAQQTPAEAETDITVVPVKKAKVK